MYPNNFWQSSNLAVQNGLSLYRTLYCVRIARTQSPANEFCFYKLMLKRGLRAIVGLAAPRAAAAGQASGPTPASWRTRTAGSPGPGAFGSGLRESQWTRANGLRALSGHI